MWKFRKNKSEDLQKEVVKLKNKVIHLNEELLSVERFKSRVEYQKANEDFLKASRERAHLEYLDKVRKYRLSVLKSNLYLRQSLHQRINFKGTLLSFKPDYRGYFVDSVRVAINFL